MRQFLTVVLWFSAIGCGLMAGVYFAFSAFIMTSFARIDSAAGVAAMNAVNVDIVRSPFMPIFMATTLVAALLAGLAILHWSEPGSLPMLAGGAMLVIGMFVVTLVFNVPLNNALAAVGAADVEAQALWACYLRDWTFWNHARLIASLGASVLFTMALVARSAS